MRAAISGPDGKNMTASNGKKPHEITKVKTKNVMIGWRLTSDTVCLLSPARERRDVSRCDNAILGSPAHLPKTYSPECVEGVFSEVCIQHRRALNTTSKP